MRIRPLATIAVLIALVVGACGAAATPTPEPSPTPTPVCAALADLQASFAALEDVDPLDDGLQGYADAVDAIRTDVADLRSAAGDQLGGQLDALTSAIDDLQGTLDSLGDGSLGGALREIGDGLSALGTAITELRSEAGTAFGECSES